MLCQKKYFLVMILVFSLVFIVHMSNSWAWYNTAWGKRMPIDINVSDGSTLTNHQTFVNVTYDADMKNFPDDLLFIASDDSTELDFCCGSDCPYDSSITNGSAETVASSYTECWVEVDTINSTIYLYYDNAGASSASNPDATFNLYDHFTGTSLDTSKWTEQYTDNATTVADSVLHLYPVDTNKGYTLVVSNGSAQPTLPEDNVSIDAYWRNLNYHSYSAVHYREISYGEEDNIFVTSGWYGYLESSYHWHWQTQTGGQTGDRFYEVDADGVRTTHLDNLDYTTEEDLWNVTSYTILDGNHTMYTDGQYIGSKTDTTFTSLAKYLHLGQGHYYSNGNPMGSDGEIDWVTVRKYHDVDPTYTFGTEESGVLPFIKIYQYAQIKSYTNDTVTYNLTIAVINNRTSTISNVTVDPDDNYYSGTYEISNLGAKEVNTSTFSNSYTRTNWTAGEDEQYVNISSTTLSGDVNGTSNTITLMNPWNPQTKEKAVAIGLSTTLAINVSFTVSPPVTNKPADGNNGTGVTEYWVLVESATNTNADLYIKADGDLIKGVDTIPLANEKFRYNTTNSSVPSGTYTSLTTTYSDNPIGSDLTSGSYSYLKFYLNVSAGTPAGSYSNYVYVKGVPYGESP